MPGLRFWGGKGVSFLPLLIFISLALYSAIEHVPDVRGMWAGAALGLMLTLPLAKDTGLYARTIINGMAHPMALLPIACWLFAGIFANVLQASGLVKGIIWLAGELGAHGPYFVLVSFVASAVFATATGTGLGTIIAGMTLLYPAGVILGAPPLVLAGSIIGGGAFGDNIAAISDTTICSAATQDTDVGGVVRSRLRYALVAGFITLLILTITVFRAGGEFSREIVDTHMDPLGLVMIIPAVFTTVLAVMGWHIIAATTLGTMMAVLTGYFSGLLPLGSLFFIKDGVAGGHIVAGIEGILDVSMLTILLLACVHILQKGGGDRLILDFLGSRIKTIGEAEFAMVLVVLFMSTLMAINVAPVLAAGITFVRPLGQWFNIHPYRRANILDATACTLVYTLPWAPSILMARALSIKAFEEMGPAIPVLEIPRMIPHIYYCYALLGVILFAVASGWGRRMGD